MYLSHKKNYILVNTKDAIVSSTMSTTNLLTKDKLNFKFYTKVY